MRILDIFEDLDIEEARRNNFGREVSNAQGQALGKKLAAGDPNAQQGLAQAKNAQATNQTDATGDTLGQTTPQQRLAAKQAAAPAPQQEPAQQPTAQEPEQTQQQPEPVQGQQQPKGPGALSKIGGALATGAKAVGGAIGKAADAAPGVLNKVGNIGAAATDAVGRTAAGLKTGYEYGRGRETQSQIPGQRTGQQQGGGVVNAFAQGFNGNQGGGQAPAPQQQAPAQRPGVNFNTVMKAIPKFTPKQKAAIAKAVGAGQAKPAGAPPAPQVVQGGKPPAPQQAVAEGFHSKFLGMII